MVITFFSKRKLFLQKFSNFEFRKFWIFQKLYNFFDFFLLKKKTVKIATKKKKITKCAQLDAQSNEIA